MAATVEEVEVTGGVMEANIEEVEATGGVMAWRLLLRR